MGNGKDGVKFVPLKEVAHYVRERKNASEVDAHTYVGVESMVKGRRGKRDARVIPTEGRVTAYKEGDVLIGNICPKLRKIWLADREGGASGDVLVIRSNDPEVMLPEYLYNVLASDDFFVYDIQYTKKGTIPRGDKARIMDYMVPVPGMEEQKKVSKVLLKMQEVNRLGY